MSLVASVVCEGIRTTVVWAAHTLACMEGAVEYGSTLVKRLDPVLSTSPSLMAGPGRVVPLGWEEPAVLLGSVMTFHTVNLAIGVEVEVHPLVMEAI